MPTDDPLRSASTLLCADDPPPVRIANPNGRSPFLLTADHAGNVVPSALGTLGLDDDERARHIGWDIGVDALGLLLSEALDAVFVRQTYSRLVIDCNRDPASEKAVPPVSDDTPVPANRSLSDADLKARVAEIHEPYHQAIAAEIARRAQIGQDTILVSLHSFTPALRANGLSRPWPIGVLHDGGDASFAKRLLAVLRKGGELLVGNNEPYTMNSVGYTIPRHAYATGLLYAELEIRQDLLMTAKGVAGWKDTLASALPSALRP